MADNEEETFLEWLNKSMKKGLAESIVPDREKLKKELEIEQDPDTLIRVL